jgi:hypothetical protein
MATKLTRIRESIVNATWYSYFIAKERRIIKIIHNIDIVPVFMSVDIAAMLKISI